MIERTPLWHRLQNAHVDVDKARERFEAMHDYDDAGDASPEGVAFQAAIDEVSAAGDAVCEMEMERDRLRAAIRNALGRLGFKAGLTEFGRIHEATRILNEAIAKGAK